MGMNGIYLSHVTRINRETSKPRLIFSADWMADMGFVPGALVQYLPEKHGITFVLCNENIHRYSDLSHATKKKGGSLIQVYHYTYGLQLSVSGSALDCTELKYGDALIARYEYGLIRIRKLPQLPHSAVTLVSSHISGAWMPELGFTQDAALTIAAEFGLITCTLQENDISKLKARTAEMVKHARKHKLTLIQVQKTKYKKRVSRGQAVYQFFDIPDTCLEKAGFSPNEMLLAYYSPGLIKLQKPDFVGLGF